MTWALAAVCLIAGLAAGSWLWQLPAGALMKTVIVVVSTVVVFFGTTRIVGDQMISGVRADMGAIMEEQGEGIGALVIVLPTGIWSLGAMLGAAMEGVLWGLACGALWLVALGLGAVLQRRRALKGPQ